MPELRFVSCGSACGGWVRLRRSANGKWRAVIVTGQALTRASMLLGICLALYDLNIELYDVSDDVKLSARQAAGIV